MGNITVMTLRRLPPVSKGSLLYPVLFFMLVAVALVLRLMALKVVSGSIYATILLPDEHFYHTWAVALLSGKPPTGAFQYAPLPAYFLALLYWLFGVNIDLFRSANILLGVGGCIFIYLIAVRISGRNWALVALALAACSRELIFFSTIPLKTSLAFFLFSSFVSSTLMVREKYSRTNLIIPGVILGLVTMVRPNALIMFPVLLLLFFLDHRRQGQLQKLPLRATLFSLGFMLAIVPFSLHNYSSSHIFSILPTQSGYLFYCTNTVTNPTPLYKPVPFASSHPDEQGIHFRIEASRRVGTPLDDKEASWYWQKQILLEAMEQPSAFAAKICNKILMLFNHSENGDHYHIGFLSQHLPFFKLFPLTTSFFMVFGYSAILLGMRQSESMRTLALLLAAYLLTLLLYSVDNRFFLPLLAILIPAATSLLSRLFTELRYLLTPRARQARSITDNSTDKEKNPGARLLFPAALLAFFILIGRIEVEGSGDLSLHHNNLAFMHSRNGNVPEAINHWQRSAESHQTYADVALLFLAAHEYQVKGAEASIRIITSIADTSFLAAAKYATLGDIYKHQNRLTDASAAYNHSLSINWGQRRVRQELIEIYQLSDHHKEMKERKNLAKINAYYTTVK